VAVVYLSTSSEILVRISSSKSNLGWKPKVAKKGNIIIISDTSLVDTNSAISKNYA
jgi:hypothetical protein